MATFLSKVSSVLKNHFTGATVDIVQSPESKKVGGFLIWDGFSRKDHIKRQALLWKALESDLSQDQQHRVSMIVTLTPDEAFVEVDENPFRQ